SRTPAQWPRACNGSAGRTSSSSTPATTMASGRTARLRSSRYWTGSGPEQPVSRIDRQCNPDEAEADGPIAVERFPKHEHAAQQLEGRRDVLQHADHRIGNPLDRIGEADQRKRVKHVAEHQQRCRYPAPEHDVAMGDETAVAMELAP